MEHNQPTPKRPLPPSQPTKIDKRYAEFDAIAPDENVFERPIMVVSAGTGAVYAVLILLAIGCAVAFVASFHAEDSARFDSWPGEKTIADHLNVLSIRVTRPLYLIAAVLCGAWAWGVKRFAPRYPQQQLRYNQRLPTWFAPAVGIAVFLVFALVMLFG